MIDTTVSRVPAAALLTPAEVAIQIGAPARWVREAARRLPATRSLAGHLRIDAAHLGAYRAAYAAARGRREVRA